MQSFPVVRSAGRISGYLGQEEADGSVLFPGQYGLLQRIAFFISLRPSQPKITHLIKSGLS
jgi:hypothetical protein